MWCFPCGSAGKESACNAGDLDSIPGLGRSPGEGKGYPLAKAVQPLKKPCARHNTLFWGATFPTTSLSHSLPIPLLLPSLNCHLEERTTSFSFRKCDFMPHTFF